MCGAGAAAEDEQPAVVGLASRSDELANEAVKIMAGRSSTVAGH